VQSDPSALRASGVRTGVLSLPRAARRSATIACIGIALVGLLGGAVRLLPWLLDPAVPWRVAAPFARGLAAVALEAALLIGWPIGWAVACFRFVESGQARVLSTLGERPEQTVRRLVPQGLAFAAALCVVALVYGSDANAPGRVVTELIEDARVSCAAVRAPSTYAVPFTGLTWLCAPGREPRLVGSVPGGLSGALVTARSARVAGDFRVIDLDDARVLLPGTPAESPAGNEISMHVAVLSMRGMAPWARASTLPAALRAPLLALAAWISASVAALAVLGGATKTRLGVIVLGAAGPLGTLAFLRLLERAGASAPLFLLLPLAACALASGCGLAARAWGKWGVGPPLLRLRRTGRAASK
jgi:hypothetical protein